MANPHFALPRLLLFCTEGLYVHVWTPPCMAVLSSHPPKAATTWSKMPTHKASGGEAHAEPGPGATMQHIWRPGYAEQSLRVPFCYGVWENDVPPSLLHQSVEDLACQRVFSLPGGARDSMGASSELKG